jgi:hypothetical protein
MRERRFSSARLSTVNPVFAPSEKGRALIVSIFAFRIGVMDDQAKADATGHGRPLQHFEIALGIAERDDRTATDVFIDEDRLAGPVVDEIQLRQAEKLLLAIAHLELVLIERSTTFSGCAR